MLYWKLKSFLPSLCLHFNGTNNRVYNIMHVFFFAGVDEEIRYGGAVQVKVQHFLHAVDAFFDVQQHESHFENELHASWAPYVDLLKQFQNNLPFTNTLRILQVKCMLIMYNDCIKSITHLLKLSFWPCQRYSTVEVKIWTQKQREQVVPQNWKN